MFPLLTGLISGGAGLLGNMFSSQTSAANTQATINANAQSQAEAQQFNAAEAEKNRNFQYGEAQNQMNYQSVMSNTAYQRASADMKKAGLNPAMMFGSGSAASSPAGASGSGATASTSPMKYDYSGRTSPFSDLGKSVEAGVNSAVQAKTIDKMTDEISNLKVQRNLITADTAATTAKEAQTKQETRTEEQRTVHEASQASRSQLAQPAERLKAEEAEQARDIPGYVRRPLVQGKYIMDKAGDILAPIANTATKVIGAEILGKAFRQGKDPNAWSRGYNAGSMRNANP